MVSTTKITIPPQATTAERDALGTSLPSGSRLWNSDDGMMNVTPDGGTTWLVEVATPSTSGVLDIPHGGTNAENKTAGFDNLAPTATKGDIIAHDGTDNTAIPVVGDGAMLITDASDPAGLAWGNKVDFIQYTNDTNGFVDTLVTDGYIPKTIIKVAQEDNMDFGAAVKQSLTVNWRVEEVLASDPSDQPIVGYVYFSSPGPGGFAHIVDAQLVKMKMDSVTNAVRGDKIRVSTTDTGTFESTALTEGMIGVAACDAPSNTDLNVWLTSTNTTEISLPVAIDEGGTAATTKTEAFDNLAPTSTKADIIVHNGTDNVTLSGGGEPEGTFLRVNPADPTGLCFDNVATFVDYLQDTNAFVGNTVSSSYRPKTIIRVIQEDTMALGAPVKASTTTNYRVEEVDAADDENQPIIGFVHSSNVGVGAIATLIGAQIVQMRMDTVTTASLGDKIRKSSTNDGKVESTTEFTGVFGVVAKAAASNALVDVWLTQNDNDAASITLPLAVDEGGTAQTSYTNGQLLIGNTTGNTLAKATLTEGNGITVTNATGAITLTVDQTQLDIETIGGALTEGSVLYASSTGQVKQDNANFFFNEANNSLSLGSTNSTFSISDPLTFSFVLEEEVAAPQGVALVNHNNTTGAGQQIQYLRSRGTEATPTTVANLDELGTIDFAGYDGTTHVNTGFIRSIVDGTVALGDVPSKLVLQANGTSNIATLTLKPETEGVLELGVEKLKYTETVLGSSYAPCTTMRVIADGLIQAGAPLTASASTAFRVIQITTGADLSTPIIGFAVDAAAIAGDEIEICDAQLVTVQMDAIDTAALGDIIHKSDSTIGRVRTSTLQEGTFAVVAETAASNATFKAWITHQIPTFEGLAPTNTKGDMIVFDGTTNKTLPVGTNGQVITADSSDANGVIWKRPTGMFSQTNSVTVANTAAETTIKGTIVGSDVIPANTMLVGDTCAFKAGGTIETNGAAQTIQFRVKAGAVIFVDTGVITLSNIGSPQFFEFEFEFTVRTLGAATTGVVVSNGQLTYLSTAGGGSYEGEGVTTINSTTFDTTISNTVDLTVEWGAASASNSIVNDLFVMHKVY